MLCSPSGISLSHLRHTPLKQCQTCPPFDARLACHHAAGQLQTSRRKSPGALAPYCGNLNNLFEGNGSCNLARRTGNIALRQAAGQAAGAASRCLRCTPHWARQAQRRQRSAGPPAAHQLLNMARCCMPSRRRGNGSDPSAVVGALLLWHFPPATCDYITLLIANQLSCKPAAPQCLSPVASACPAVLQLLQRCFLSAHQAFLKSKRRKVQFRKHSKLVLRQSSLRF